MPNILIGVASGIISGFGMGGGTILILLLNIFSNLDQHMTQATNLVFFIPTSIAAILINIKNKNIDIKLAIITSISGIIGATIGALISAKTDVIFLRKSFGIFLAIIAIHEIYVTIKEYRREKKRNTIKKRRK